MCLRKKNNIFSMSRDRHLPLTTVAVEDDVTFLLLVISGCEWFLVSYETISRARVSCFRCNVNYSTARLISVQFPPSHGLLIGTDVVQMTLCSECSFCNSE
jgi:hypothetical protein